jgi:hypothetical protein
MYGLILSINIDEASLKSIDKTYQEKTYMSIV